MQEDDSQEMDTLWGEDVIALRAENAERGQLFNDGNYAMFIHWGPYAQLANKVDGKTYYGIGEWIMNPRMANSWAFAWYDEYWKTPREILRPRLPGVGRRVGSRCLLAVRR